MKCNLKYREVDLKATALRPQEPHLSQQQQQQQSGKFSFPFPGYLCNDVIFNRGYKGRKHYRKLADSKERKKEKVSLHQAPDAGAGEGILVQYVLDP